MSHSGLEGLGNINIELTSRCNKDCWMCGRRKIDREYPEIALEYGDMEFALVQKIAAQLPPNIVVQLHNNGEPLLYPEFGDAVRLFPDQITNIVTNGKLLVKKADEIIDNLDTLSISIIENDKDAEEQFTIIEEFLHIKGDRKPYTNLRLVGDVDRERYKKFGLLMVSRVLHSPVGSFNYRKKDPTVPEIGICWDFLYHMAINSKGEASICVRFDPKRLGVIGNANEQALADIWNGPTRMEWLRQHKQGRRDLVPLCSFCHFWGVPTGNDYKDRDREIDENCVYHRDSRPESGPHV